MFRTPGKAAKGAAHNRTMTLSGRDSVNGEGVPTRSVRRSIDGWETGKPENQSQLSLAPPLDSPAGPSGTLPSAHRQSSGSEYRVTSPQILTSKANDHVTRARTWLGKAKQHISASKNLKLELRQGVLEAVEKLFQLVKEASSSPRSQRVTPQPAKPPELVVENKDREEIKEKERRWEELIGKQMELIKENNEKMKELKETIERKTYASVAATTSRVQAPVQTLHSVVVTAKDEMKTGEEVLNRIKKVVKAKEGGIIVERIRKGRDRKVIIGCRSEKEREKLTQELAGAPELTVEEIQNKDPLVILYGVLNSNTDEDLTTAIRNQNRHLLKEVKGDDDRMEIRYRRKARNPLTSHVVVKVSPQIWQSLVDAGAVHIDLQRVRVADQSPLVQCSRCLGYGHGRRQCTGTVDVCSHCGGEHMRTDCPDWQIDIPPRCVNCVKGKSGGRSDHNAFSNDCPVRRKWDTLARSTVAYC